MVIQFPPIKFDHIKNMTDDTGFFQHAKFCVPKRREGYTTDDNARALVACTMYHRLKKDATVEALAENYLAFLNHMQKPEGAFHNYLSYERTYIDVDGSEDCMGRALWSLGCVINSTLPSQVKMAAADIFSKGLPSVWKSMSLRFYSSTILGLSQYYFAVRQNDLAEAIAKLADSMLRFYQNQAGIDWHWFEPYLIYDNARLPQALFEAYMITHDKKHLEVAEESMDFLVKTQIIKGFFVPIGNNGWYKRGERRAIYDQQPLESTAMVEAAVDAFYATNNRSYMQIADIAFEWFFGRNTGRAIMYNSETGGCFDGLSADSINMNQGAESSISYLLARLKLEEEKRGFWKHRRV